MQYEIVVRPDGEQFRAICPQLPGIVGYGASAGQALDAAIQALSKRLELGSSAPLEIMVVRADVRPTQHRT